MLGYLYFTVSYPTSDGDVLKASYMLTTAPAWALAFGYAVDRLPGPVHIVEAALILAASALASLPLLLYDRRDSDSLHLRRAARRHREGIPRAGATRSRPT